MSEYGEGQSDDLAPVLAPALAPPLAPALAPPLAPALAPTPTPTPVSRCAPVCGGFLVAASASTSGCRHQETATNRPGLCKIVLFLFASRPPTYSRKVPLRPPRGLQHPRRGPRGDTKVLSLEFYLMPVCGLSGIARARRHQQWQGRCPRAIGWLIGVRCVPSGRAEMPCATLPTASSYPRTLPRPCRAPGAMLRRRKWLLQHQRDHSADIRSAIKMAEQHYCPGHHSRFGTTYVQWAMYSAQ